MNFELVFTPGVALLLALLIYIVFAIGLGFFASVVFGPWKDDHEESRPDSDGVGNLPAGGPRRPLEARGASERRAEANAPEHADAGPEDESPAEEAGSLRGTDDGS